MSTLTTRIPRRLVEHAKPGVRWSLQHAIPRGALVRVASQGDPQGVLSTETTGLLPEELAPILARIRGGGAIVTGALSTRDAAGAVGGARVIGRCDEKHEADRGAIVAGAAHDPGAPTDSAAPVITTLESSDPDVSRKQPQ